MWFALIGGTYHFQCFLYDMDHHTILGELLNASPIFMNRDQSKLLCVQHTKGTRSLQAWLSALRQRITHPMGGSRSLPVVIESLWVLDLNRNTATRIAKVFKSPSEFQPSPGFRFGYTQASEVLGQWFLLCDLEKPTMTRINVAGYPQGWWDENQIIIKDPTNNFVLYDVRTQKRSPLWTAAQVAEFFDKMNIPGDPAAASLFSIWNGKENDFYLTDLHKKWLAVESYLIKVERPGAALKLVSRSFKFEWSDHLDPTGTWYVYSGRQSGQASSAVFLRDLRNNTDRTLVPSDGGGYFSIPRFYRDGVIYTRSNMLWQISLDGSNQARLFPPPETQPGAAGRTQLTPR
jgi:hypothetical protein